VECSARPTGPRTARIRPRARRGASASGGRTFLSRHGHQLLGWLVERDHSPARRDALRGLLRVVRREAGIRIYARTSIPPPLARPDSPRTPRRARGRPGRQVRAIAGAELSMVARRLRYAVPQWTRELGATVTRAKRRLAHARVTVSIGTGLLTNRLPRRARRFRSVARAFDPVVWDRRRFELLWGWAYRFEAYTPVAKRKRDTTRSRALARPRHRWGKVSVKGGTLDASFATWPRSAKEPRVPARARLRSWTAALVSRCQVIANHRDWIRGVCNLRRSNGEFSS